MGAACGREVLPAHPYEVVVPGAEVCASRLGGPPLEVRAQSIRKRRQRWWIGPAAHLHHRTEGAPPIPIVTDVMRALTVRADRCGCAIKPSGAGGGDIVFAVGPNASAMDELARECASLGVTPLDLRVDARGAISVAEPR